MAAYSLGRNKQNIRVTDGKRGHALTAYAAASAAIRESTQANLHSVQSKKKSKEEAGGV